MLVARSRLSSSRWRLLLALLLAACALVPLFVPAVAQEQPDLGISSRRYIVIDADTGEVFAAKGADERAAMASLTKMFTMIEALDRAPLDLQITTDESDLFDSSSTTMGFGPGETFTLEELLFGMMLPSGNDAAHAIARTIGREDGDTPQQSVDRFVGWMNERLRNMGLTGTNLVNPHGLGVPNHYSTVHDLAAFTRYALRYPLFATVIGTAEYTTSNGYTVTNTNKLLSQYPDLVGGKTGYDEESGYCLIEVARRDGSTMISVTLDGVAPDVWYQDNATLLDFAFERKAQRIAAGDPISENVVTFRDPDAAIVEAIITPGAVLGAPDVPTPTAAPTLPPSIAPAATPTVEVTAGGSRRAGQWRLFGVVAALVLIVVAIAVSGAFRGTARSPGNPTSSGEPPGRSPD